jgi:uncharacterized protein (DUF302 family)
MSTPYGFGTKIPVAYEQAVPQVVDALKTEGFGVLTEIDVKATFKQKLGVDHNSYIILGACNPHLAHQALQAEPQLGLLLPCNVIVYANEDETSTVSFVDPLQMLSVAGNPDLETVAQEASARLGRVLERLQA